MTQIHNSHDPFTFFANIKWRHSYAIDLMRRAWRSCVLTRAMTSPEPSSSAGAAAPETAQQSQRVSPSSWAASEAKKKERKQTPQERRKKERKRGLGRRKSSSAPRHHHGFGEAVGLPHRAGSRPAAGRLRCSGPHARCLCARRCSPATALTRGRASPTQRWS